MFSYKPPYSPSHAPLFLAEARGSGWGVGLPSLVGVSGSVAHTEGAVGSLWGFAADVTGTVGVLGAALVPGAAGVSGATDVTGTVGVPGAAGVSGAALPVGAAPVSGAVGVPGAAPVLGAVDVSDTALVPGAALAVDATPALGVTGATGVLGAALATVSRVLSVFWVLLFPRVSRVLLLLCVPLLPRVSRVPLVFWTVTSKPSSDWLEWLLLIHLDP